MPAAEYEQPVEFLGRQFTEIDRRFEQVAGQITELRREVLRYFDELYRRLDRLEQEYHAIIQALRRIEAGVADDSGRREILGRDLTELKHQVATLQARIADIEQRLGR